MFERVEPNFTNTDLVYLQGWGEPLLHPDFWRMVRRVRAAGAAAGFTTNGTLLNSASQERLIDYGVNVVAVSLAGATAVTQERFRPECKFDELDQALVALRDLKASKCSGGPRVHLAFLLLRSNLEEVPGLVDLAQRWGASEIVISDLRLVGTQEVQRESIASHPDLWPRVEKVLETTRQKAAAHGMGVHYSGPPGAEYRTVCLENVLKACFISHRGEVSPCVFTNVSFEPEGGHPPEDERVVFGNLRDQSLPQIWTSDKAEEFRTAHRKRLEAGSTEPFELPAPCRRCLGA